MLPEAYCWATLTPVTSIRSFAGSEDEKDADDENTDDDKEERGEEADDACETFSFVITQPTEVLTVAVLPCTVTDCSPRASEQLTALLTV